MNIYSVRRAGIQLRLLCATKGLKLLIGYSGATSGSKQE